MIDELSKTKLVFLGSKFSWPYLEVVQGVTN